MSKPRPPHVSLKTTEPTAFGHGWISGVLSLALGLTACGTVICIQFPQWFTVAELRAIYPLPAVRALLHILLIAAFLLGILSVYLRRNKALGIAGMTSVGIAALLGGSQAPVGTASNPGPYLGLDWFLLNLIVYSLVFVPLEQLFALRREQRLFRTDWRTDLVYFFVSNLLVQATSLLTLRPAVVLFDWARHHAIVAFVSACPLPVQILAILLVADLAQYWVHRAFHRIPALWRFHAIHHSVEVMDWLAGSRLHLIDAIVTRSLAYIPLYVLGFSETAIMIYVVIVAAQATFIHANVRWNFRPLQRWIATPAFHHWHHSDSRDAIDRNFAVHTPVWDLLFGTYHLPREWPASYGLSGAAPMPRGWVRQHVYPFQGE